ncbi:PAS domain-containing protein [Cellulophaga baltica]|uniref:PAS domain-containing sensor histidine kinase n=1 Tax=Cellulophaga TaxID=104264 RepID=UPI001C06FEE7|nr:MULTISPECIES: ATP-binding protein [Cellulophaga]MBU2995681.1 PAS domain-containing protein [Cellulophaga baltica]MDO6767075.1 PAS domain-containing protein [Cellulophaga sp. 1_MG-2023]
MKVSETFSHLNKDEAFVKNATSPIAILDENLNFLSCSKKWESVYKTPLNSILGENFFEAMPNFPKCFQEKLAGAINGESQISNGKSIQLNNGQPVCVKYNIRPRVSNKRITGVIAELTMTESNNMESLLDDAQKVARTGAWEVDLKTNKVLWTKMVNIIHEVEPGYTPSTYEECFEHFKEGEYRNKIYEAANRAVNENIPWDEEVIMITAKGKEIWIRTKGQAEFIDGQCVRIYGICQDINEFKLEELKYREAAEQLKRAVTVSKVATWEFHLNDKLAIWDDTCFELHNIDKNNYNGSLFARWKKSIHPDDVDVIENLFTEYKNEITSKTNTIHYRVLFPNNQVRTLKATLTFISEIDSKTYKAVGVCVDVTKEKIAEKKLKQYANITSEQNNNLTNFAHMVSHDLRAHSTNLSVLTRLLLDEKNEDQKTQILAMLKSATDSLNSTVYNLNEVTQSSDTTNIEEKLSQVNLLKVLQNVKNNISLKFNKKEATSIFDVPPNVEVTVVPAYLDSILLNLFSNSLNYSAPQRKPVITVKSKTYGNKTKIDFIDNGRGIDLNVAGKNIFGMNKTFHRNKDARGVGLYITKNQVEAMGGNISVTSKIDVGTTFTITLNK